MAVIGLGGCHGDFRTGLDVDNVVCLSGNGGSYYIDNGKCRNTLFLDLPECGKAVRRLSGLGDDYAERTLWNRKIPVAELGCQLHPHRQTGHILNHILGRNPAMVGRAACHDENLFKAFQFIRGQADIDFLSVDYAVDCVFQDLGLLMDFLHHEMLETALLGSLGGVCDL